MGLVHAARSRPADVQFLQGHDVGLLLGEDTPFPGVILASDATFLDIVPGRRVIVGQTMTLGERRLSLALITYEILDADGGSELVFTHQAAFFEGADGPKMREDGWRTLLESLSAELAR